jgi:hypothetical protein
MNSLVRPLLSATVFLSLLGLLAHAVVTSGVSGDRAVFVFCLLAMQGLVECALLSYRAPSVVGARMRLRLEDDSAEVSRRVVAIAADRSSVGSLRSTHALVA